MTIYRLKELGKRLFGLGNKTLEFSYLTKEVNLNYSKYNLILYNFYDEYFVFQLYINSFLIFLYLLLT